MTRGTTAPFAIQLPYTMGELEWITMKWWQEGNKGTQVAPLPITKTLSNCLSKNYICKLESGITAARSYYFTIEGILYMFTATTNLVEGTLLKYDSTTQQITSNAFTGAINVSAVGDSGGMVQLTFVNEAYDSDILHVVLTAEETMRFSDKHKAKMQFRAKLKSNGRVFGNQSPKLITVYPMNDDLLEEDIVPSSNNYGWVVLDGGSIAAE